MSAAPRPDVRFTPRWIASYRSPLIFWALASLLIGRWLFAMPALDGMRLDLGYYLSAAQRVAAGASAYGGNGSYIYPPLLAHALARIPLSPRGIAILWNGLLACSLLLTIGLGARAAQLARHPLAALAFALLFAEPSRTGAMLGNASLIVAAILALSASCIGTMPVVAGVLLGLAASIKIIPAVILAWIAGMYVQRRERAWLTTGLACFATLVVGLLNRDGLAFFESVNAAVDRRVLLGANFSWSCLLERAFGVKVAGALGLSLGAALAFVLGLRTPHGPEAARSGWGIAQLIALATAPVAWSHLFVLAFWPALIAAGSLMVDPTRQTDARRWQLDTLLVALAFVILARVRFFYSPDSFAGSVIFPVAPLMAAALLAAQLLRTLRWTRVRQADQPPPGSSGN